MRRAAPMPFTHERPTLGGFYVLRGRGGKLYVDHIYTDVAGAWVSTWGDNGLDTHVDRYDCEWSGPYATPAEADAAAEALEELP